MSFDQQRQSNAWPFVLAIWVIAVLVGLFAYWVLVDVFNGNWFRSDGLPKEDRAVDASKNLPSYLAALLVLGTLSLLTWLRPNFFRIHGSKRVDTAAFTIAIVSVIAISALILIESRKFPNESIIFFFGNHYALTAIPSLFLYVAGIALAAGVLVLIRIAPGLVRHNILLLVAYLWVLAVTLYGMKAPISLEALSASALVDVEVHFDAVFGPAELLITGLPSNTMGYGYLSNLLIAALQTFFGRWNLADYVLFVQYGNVVYAILALVACHLLARRRPMVALAVLLLVAPWVHSAHQGLFFSNQAGWRFLAIPLAMAAFGFGARLSLRYAAIVVGSVAGFAIAWNLETGVAVAFGCAAYLFFRLEKLLGIGTLRTGLLFLGPIVFVLLCSALVEEIMFGSLSLTGAFWTRLTQQQSLGGGFGLPFYLDTRAIVLGGFAAWVFAEVVVARGRGAISRAVAQRGAIAAMGLCWGAYYVARPDQWNLWSYLLPFGFLVVDRLVRTLEPGRGKSLVPAIVPAAVIVLVLGPAALTWNYQMANALSRQLAISPQSSAGATELSGVRLDSNVANALGERSQYLAGMDCDPIVFTGNVFLMPKQSGKPEAFPGENYYFLLAEPARFDDFFQRTNWADHECILIDDPDVSDQNPTSKAIMSEIEARISSDYANTNRVAGWSVWRVKP